MNSYGKILMSRWRGVTMLKAPDLSKQPKLIDQDEMNVTYPINEITRNRDATIVRAMDARTPPLVRQQLMANIETLPPDVDNSRLSDDDKLSVMKSRYCQSRPELSDYNEYLGKLAEDGRTMPEPTPEPTPPTTPAEPTPGTDPKTD